MNSELKKSWLSGEGPVEPTLETTEECHAIADLAFAHDIDLIDFDLGMEREPGAVREDVYRAVLAGKMPISVALMLYCWHLGIGNRSIVKAAKLFADFNELEAAKTQLDTRVERGDISTLFDYLDFQAARL